MIIVSIIFLLPCLARTLTLYENNSKRKCLADADAIQWKEIVTGKLCIARAFNGIHEEMNTVAVVGVVAVQSFLRLFYEI